jgi:hypothetical protein
MKRQTTICMSFVGLLLTPAFSQLASNSTTACTFQDGKEVSVQYEKTPAVKKVELAS